MYIYMIYIYQVILFLQCKKVLWSYKLLQQQLRENMTQGSLIIPSYLITDHDWSLMNLMHPYLMIQLRVSGQS